MPELSIARRLPLDRLPGSAPRSRPAWWPPTHLFRARGAPAPRPPWPSPLHGPAGLRTVRAVLVVPSLFALTFEGFGNLQMALFAAFGGFASLIMAAVGGITWLAVLVTIPVAFGIFFAGVAGPNAASGVTAALLPYVLPVATPGTVSMIPDRLAGWWLASAVSTAAVLLLPTPSPGDRLREAAAGSARALAAHLTASVNGTATAEDAKACQAAKHQLMTAFASTPYRPVGLATADQGMASVVQLLEWCTALIADATDGHPNLDRAAQADRDLLGVTAAVLRQTADLLAGTTRAQPDVTAMDRQREASAAYHRTAAD